MICNRRATKAFEIDPIAANVVRLRPRNAASAGSQALDEAPVGSATPPFELPELSHDRLHARRDLVAREAGHDDLKVRMRVTIAAMIFLVALAGLAAGTVLRLEAQMAAEMVRGGLI